MFFPDPFTRAHLDPEPDNDALDPALTSTRRDARRSSLPPTFHRPSISPPHEQAQAPPATNSRRASIQTTNPDSLPSTSALPLSETTDPSRHIQRQPRPNYSPPSPQELFKNRTENGPPNYALNAPPPQGQGLPPPSRGPDYQPQSQPPVPAQAQTPYPPSPYGPPAPAPPSHLTLDRDLIFPPPPSQALYALQYAISASGASNTLYSCSPPPPGGPPGGPSQTRNDKPLYTITRSPLSRDEFALRGLRRSAHPGTLTLRKERTWTGKSYWVLFSPTNLQLLLKSQGEYWVDGLDRVCGREPGGVALGRERRAELRREREEGAAGGVRRCPELELLGPAREGAPDWEGRVDWRVRDLVVAVWVAKWWWVEWKVGGGG